MLSEPSFVTNAASLDAAHLDMDKNADDDFNTDNHDTEDLASNNGIFIDNDITNIPTLTGTTGVIYSILKKMDC